MSYHILTSFSSNLVTDGNFAQMVSRMVQSIAKDKEILFYVPNNLSEKETFFCESVLRTFFTNIKITPIEFYSLNRSISSDRNKLKSINFCLTAFTVEYKLKIELNDIIFTNFSFSNASLFAKMKIFLNNSLRYDIEQSETDIEFFKKEVEYLIYSKDKFDKTCIDYHEVFVNNLGQLAPFIGLDKFAISLATCFLDAKVCQVMFLGRASVMDHKTILMPVENSIIWPYRITDSSYELGKFLDGLSVGNHIIFTNLGKQTWVPIEISDLLESHSISFEVRPDISSISNMIQAATKGTGVKIALPYKQALVYHSLLSELLVLGLTESNFIGKKQVVESSINYTLSII